jgi:hypothetical protein
MLATWLVAIGCAATALGGWEASWRLRGFTPSMRDSAELWTTWRRRASREGESAAALVGGSRIQLGIDLNAFEEVVGVRPIQLAIDGAGPFAVLQDLARDKRFRGDVVCSLMTYSIFVRGPDGSEEYVEESWQMPLSIEIETALSAQVHSALACLSPSLSARGIAQALMDGRLPRPPYAPMRADRSRPADFALTDAVGMKAARLARQRQGAESATPVPMAEFMAGARELEGLVRAIQARGGRVVFVRFPTSPDSWALTEEVYPKEVYWDAFARSTSAFTVHFMDYPSLQGFDCPDSSHLDRRDAPAFTRALAEIIRAQLHT